VSCIPRAAPAGRAVDHAAAAAAVVVVAAVLVAVVVAATVPASSAVRPDFAPELSQPQQL
jgi:hypothetical protein